MDTHTAFPPYDPNQALILWGVELSPYTLKLQAALQYKGMAYRRLPAQGSRLENAAIMLRLRAAKKGGDVQRYPAMDTQLDEYPLVPYLTQDKNQFEYDSSSILQRFEDQNIGPPLIPDDPSLRFIATFLDKAFDEFGLYLVHHMRWVVSAKSNQMGRRLASEFKTALPPGGAWFLQSTFPARQVRRLPYLMSVAPRGFKASVRSNRRPKAHRDFPPTHAMLEQSWRSIVLALEKIFRSQNYVLGSRFSIADASIYGQLGMNLVDPEAANELKRIAPSTFAWLTRIQQGRFTSAEPANHELHPKMDALLDLLMGTFSALMVQNERAYEHALKQGQRIFNEEAFNSNRAIYAGKLHGHPFKSVVKTFQVRVWRDLKKQWAALSESEKKRLESRMQLTELFAS